MTMDEVIKVLTDPAGANLGSLGVELDSSDLTVAGVLEALLEIEDKDKLQVFNNVLEYSLNEYKEEDNDSDSDTRG